MNVAVMDEGANHPPVKEHLLVLGRVAMALLGDTAEVERVLEQVARESGAKPGPDGVKPIVWLLGLVRGACATKLSKMPLRTRSPIAVLPERAELQALPPTEREAVVLVLVGGLSAAEVALACNVDEGTAKTRISRGLKQLQEQEKSR